MRVLVLAVVALALAGCAVGQGSGASPPSPVGSAPSGAGASAVAQPTRPVPSYPVPSQPVPSQPAAPRRSDCVASTELATVRPEQPGPICLVAGATLRVTSAPSPQRPWQPLSTSDSSVLACTSAPGADGTIDGTCRALRAGTALLSTSTGRRPGGPDGLPDYLWQQTVLVVT
jgi:hypothetical protein